MLFIMLVLASLPFTLLFDWYRVYAGILILGTVIAWALFKFDCPLTVIENQYRKQYGGNPLKPDFISYHLKRRFNVPFSTNIVWYGAYAYLAAILIAAL